MLKLKCDWPQNHYKVERSKIAFMFAPVCYVQLMRARFLALLTDGISGSSSNSYNRLENYQRTTEKSNLNFIYPAGSLFLTTENGDKWSEWKYSKGWYIWVEHHCPFCRFLGWTLSLFKISQPLWLARLSSPLPDSCHCSDNAGNLKGISPCGCPSTPVPAPGADVRICQEKGTYLNCWHAKIIPRCCECFQRAAAVRPS